MQVYRGMDVGTGKPSPETRREFPHHGLDLAGPEEEFDVLRYIQVVLPVIRRLQREDRWAVLVGGSGLYFRVLRTGLCEAPGRDPQTRDRLIEEGLSAGAPALHERLKSVDAPAAGRIHPNDLRRIVRALEVFEVSGKPLSSWQKETLPAIPEISHAPMFGLTRDRPTLYARLEERVDRWLGNGWLEEARALRKRPLSQTAREALGYRELFDHLDGRQTWPATRDLIVRNTRRYAKRQWSWFRHEPGVEWIDAAHQASEETAAWIARRSASCAVC